MGDVVSGSSVDVVEGAAPSPGYGLVELELVCRRGLELLWLCVVVGQ